MSEPSFPKGEPRSGDGSDDASKDHRRERMARSINITSLVLSFVAAIATAISSTLVAQQSSAIKVAGVALVVMAVGAALQTVLTARAQPKLRTISLLGFPNAGKTVYLSVLYNEMIIHGAPGIQFRPYGVETAERVNEAMRRLYQGQWLPRTTSKDVFFHRARASMGVSLFAQKYKIEIPDFPGEHIGEFDSASPGWLHRTEYFRYVVESDAILLCVDCDTLRSSDGASLQSQQSALLAALQVLMDVKNIEPPRRVQIPIALLFLKGDLVPELRSSELEARVANLVAFLHAHCSHFRSFKVSAVGQTTPDGLPPTNLRPENVIEPLIWVLRN